jgi:hypothetical protein
MIVTVESKTGTGGVLAVEDAHVGTMNDETKWIIAFSHLTDFVRDFQVVLDEGDVERYHYIIGLLESALDTDLSRFKVREGRIKHPIQNPVPGRQTKHPRRVKRAYFVGQVWGLAQYLKSRLEVTSPDRRLN